MSVETKPVESCPACGSPEAKSVLHRADGIGMARCQRCRSLYLERIPAGVAGLYADGYFGLAPDHAQRNQGERIGYEESYESTFSGAGFYWAYRIADFVIEALQGAHELRSCLDVGAATGLLLNVFKSAGYVTHGIEFSESARIMAEKRGHAMFAQPVDELEASNGGFQVVTALEVIEHVEDLRGLLGGIFGVMADESVFLAYFPSADERWFGATPNYHWLNNSFEHLIYPSEAGIRYALAEAFGDDVFVATFLTIQGQDVIPHSIVVALRAPASAKGRTIVAELFRQWRYLNEAAFALMDTGPEGLGAGWLAAIEDQATEHPLDLPFVAAVTCSKFGSSAVPRFLMQHELDLERLTDAQMVDLLAMAMHQGGIDFMRDLLATLPPGRLWPDLADDFQGAVDAYDKTTLDTARQAESDDILQDSATTGE
jgi:Methyltransferase domain